MGARPAPGDQLVEVVDPDGRVVDVVTRAAMRAGRLRHRCTGIAVVDSAERLVVHRRADWKDVWPGRWDLAFGGVCDPGEPWEVAAARELAEEAGIEAALEPLGVATYEDEHAREVSALYLARHDGPFAFRDGEVVADDRVPVADLDAWLAEHETCPDSVALLVPHLRRRFLDA